MSLSLAPRVRLEEIPASTEETAPADRRSLRTGLSVLAAHYAFYGVTLIGALAPLPLAVNILCGIANGVAIALLFIIGHDGAHGGFVPSRRLNSWIARFAFVPCVHSVSLWRMIHNRLHHGFTNLKGKDGVWAPMSKEEYDAAHPTRRWLERVYRGPFGPLVYYYGAFWIHRTLLPLAPEVRSEWRRHLPDSLFVLGAFALTLLFVGVVGKAFAPERTLWQIFLIGWVIPFAVWNYLMAFTTYLNHTHPSILWFDDEKIWERYRGNLMDTANVIMPVNIAPLYTKVMSHPAHHRNMKTPVYALPDAQAELDATFGKQVEYVLTPGSYRKIYRACKLFDFKRMCWTDFDGVPTA